MVLVLHGSLRSTCTQLVMVVLKEKNVPYTFVAVNLGKGEQKAPTYVLKHPFGVVPYIDDEGFILYESRAICRYIATKYDSQGPKLIPTDIQGAALFEQAASTEVSYFSPHTRGIRWEKIVKPLIGLTRDDARIAESESQLIKSLDVYEVMLGKQKYIAGDELTLADIFHIPQGLGALPSPNGVDLLEQRPNFARWWKEINSRPSWLAVKAAFDAQVAPKV